MDAEHISPDGIKGTLKINTNRRLNYCENITMSFCVMVKGPCRGKQCDFWARIKIRKRSVEELVRNLNDSITECKDNTGFDLKITFNQFWYEIGVRDMEKLCHEEPDLCAKIKEVEDRVKS